MVIKEFVFEHEEMQIHAEASMYLEGNAWLFQVKVTGVDATPYNCCDETMDNDFGDYDDFYDENDDEELDEVIVTKIDNCYYLSFPDMGTSAPALRTLDDFELIVDLIHDAGYRFVECYAIALAIDYVRQVEF